MLLSFSEHIIHELIVCHCYFRSLVASQITNAWNLQFKFQLFDMLWGFFFLEAKFLEVWKFAELVLPWIQKLVLVLLACPLIRQCNGKFYTGIYPESLKWSSWLDKSLCCHYPIRLQYFVGNVSSRDLDWLFILYYDLVAILAWYKLILVPINLFVSNFAVRISCHKTYKSIFSSSPSCTGVIWS